MTGNGGLLQLVAQGKQDVFLTGNPQITWFKFVYRRHTNFAVESVEMYSDNKPDFGKKVSWLVPRSGDLLGPCFLEVSLPPLTLSTTNIDTPYVNSVGHALIQEITLTIGEQEIDRQTGEWMEIWSILTTTESQKQGFYQMIGKVDGYQQPISLKGPLTLYVPLQFWFCKNPGLYLPLLALQYHPVRINITFRPLQEMFWPISYNNQKCPDTTVKTESITDVTLWGDYVYLDVEERRRFVSTAHEYLIEQIQYTSQIAVPANSTNIPVPVEFNHPIREFIWVMQAQSSVSNHEWFNFSSQSVLEPAIGRTDLLTSAVLQLDGFDRFQSRTAPYFRLIQPWQRHTVIPDDNFIYCYSFALRPEELQPSGSMNASRIDTIVLQIVPNQSAGPTVGTPPTPTRENCTIRVYAKNHNVLRVVDGFGGVLFTI
jgi:hypothetical protein